jgi:hypothetical protein
MTSLSQEKHFAPYFKKTLECNGFDDQDSLANLAPCDDEEMPILTKTNKKQTKGQTKISDSNLKHFCQSIKPCLFASVCQFDDGHSHKLL